VVRFQSWQTLLQFGAEPLAQGRVSELQRVVRFTLALDVGSSALGIVIGLAGAFLFASILGWAAADAPLAAAYSCR